MAVDMFIKIGALGGESKDKAHKGEIDVLAWSWGVSQSGSMHSGGGGGSGKVNVQDLSFTKWQDAASCELIKAACKGTHIPEALLTVRKAGDKPLEHLVSGGHGSTLRSDVKPVGNVLRGVVYEMRDSARSMRLRQASRPRMARQSYTPGPTLLPVTATRSV